MKTDHWEYHFGGYIFWCTIPLSASQLLGTMLSLPWSKLTMHSNPLNHEPNTPLLCKLLVSCFCSQDHESYPDLGNIKTNFIGSPLPLLIQQLAIFLVWTFSWILWTWVELALSQNLDLKLSCIYMIKYYKMLFIHKKNGILSVATWVEIMVLNEINQVYKYKFCMITLLKLSFQ